MAAPEATFYFSLCAESFLAATRIDGLVAATQAKVVWKPVSLELLRTLTEGPIALADMAPQKEQIVMQDLGRRLRHANLPFVPAYHPGHLLHPSATDAALRVLAAAGEDRVPDVARALFAAAHERQVDLSDPEAVALAVASGVAGDIQVDLVAVAGDADGPAAAAVAANTEELSLLGGFTTPSVVVGDQLFSGEDRLHFAHHALGDTDAKPARRLASPPLDDHGSRRKLSFFFDFGSPWSYLGAMQVEKVARDCNADLELVPVVLGAIFADIGTTLGDVIGSAARSSNSQADLHRWERWLGVPLTFNKHFPLRTITPLRVFIAEPSTFHAIYRAAWVNNKNIGDDEELVKVLDAEGFDGRGLLDATRDPAIKGQLIANVERALEAGVCGVPSFQVNGGDVIWGQDRLNIVQDVLCGWDEGNRLRAEPGATGSKL